MEHAMNGYAPDPDLWYDEYPNTPHPYYMHINYRSQAEHLFGSDFDYIDQDDLDRWIVEEWILAMICLKIENTRERLTPGKILQKIRYHQRMNVEWDDWIEEEEEWVEGNGMEYPDVPA